MTSSNGNISATLAICVGNSPVTGEFPTQRPVTRSFDVFFDLRLNKRLSKQSWGRWFATLLRPLWRHCNGSRVMHDKGNKLVQLEWRNIYGDCIMLPSRDQPNVIIYIMPLHVYCSPGDSCRQDLASICVWTIDEVYMTPMFYMLCSYTYTTDKI